MLLNIYLETKITSKTMSDTIVKTLAPMMLLKDNNGSSIPTEVIEVTNSGSAVIKDNRITLKNVVASLLFSFK